MMSAAIASDHLALRACRLFETTDLNDARDQISRVMQPHSLRLHAQTAETRSHMDFLRLHGVGLGTIAFGPAAINVPPLDDYHAIIFCLRGRGILQMDREEVAIDRYQGIVCTSHRPLTGQFSPDCEQFVVRVDRQRLSAFNGRRDTRLAPRLDLRSPRLQPWLATLRGLATDPTAVRLIQEDQNVAKDYEQLLLRLLLVGQEWSDDFRERRAVRSASVRRAIDYFEAHASSAISLADVAEAAGVPERTLYDAFLRFEGVSPMRYLRNLRLDRVWNKLATSGGNDSVTSIALSSGFAHLSRFALDYAERFGERPSETLRNLQAPKTQRWPSRTTRKVAN